MKLTVSELLRLAETALVSAGPQPKSFGYNAALRKLRQVQQLVMDTGNGAVMANIPVPETSKVPVPEMSQAGQEALKNSKARAGPKKKSRAKKKKAVTARKSKSRK